MFARAIIVALVLASPAWADSDYPAGLFEHSPVSDAPAAAATIIAIGAIHGRNHAEPLFLCWG